MSTQFTDDANPVDNTLKIEPKNRLEKESSPYLKQHAANPVDWYPWGPEALAAAQAQNKPILLSVGYSACHWCHVMAHESFENEATARLMNEGFVNIKVDREERPDIDDIYMEAVQMMTRHGGWPLTVFLTPDLKPFFGGTYFPPEARQGQPSFSDVLTAVGKHYAENKEQVEKRADQLLSAIGAAGQNLSLSALEQQLDDSELTANKIANKLFPAVEQLMQQLELDADKTNGGFGRAPKFPQPSKISAMLTSPEKRHYGHAIFTLNKIRCGGITDQIGGGVARYSVDSVWLAPHFEKMLYDNAQLLPLYSYAAALVQPKNEILSVDLLEMSNGIFEYLERDLKCSQTGLYFSAEDADSEGEEGKFYTFYLDEFDDIFKTSPELKDFARKFYRVSRDGNFEGTNILTRPENMTDFRKQSDLSEVSVRELEHQARAAIFNYRNLRERPGLDHKSLLGWNALAATGLLRACAFANNHAFFQRGLELVSLIISKFKQDNNYYHTLTSNELKIDAFSDDLAYLLEACTEALLLTGSLPLLHEILSVSKTLHGKFIDPSTGTLYLTQESTELPVRPHKPEDNVLYSAHAALSGAVEKVLAWAGSQKGKTLLSRSDEKMLEALGMIALSNVASMALEMPLACAQSLQNVRWMQKKNFVFVESQTGGAPGLNQLAVLVQTLGASGTLNFAVGVPVDESVTLDALAQVARLADTSGGCTYTLCNFTGCHLPTHNVLEIAEALGDSSRE